MYVVRVVLCLSSNRFWGKLGTITPVIIVSIVTLASRKNIETKTPAPFIIIVNMFDRQWASIFGAYSNKSIQRYRKGALVERIFFLNSINSIGKVSNFYHHINDFPLKWLFRTLESKSFRFLFDVKCFMDVWLWFCSWFNSHKQRMAYWEW